jgi:hypothetical protein
MDMAQAIEISVGDVTDVEAHVYARYAGDPTEGVVLRGVICGPYCEGVRTLTADFEFRPVGSEDPRVVLAEAVVTDPCMWSAEMPHVYNVEVEAHLGEQVVAEHRGKIGLRRLAPRRPVDFAPGTG